MGMPRRPLSAIEIAETALMTAFVTAATMLFTVYIPATRGYFNVGETMVYLTALLFGPLVGGFAGGVGSALADILLGYYHFAPATLIIKGVEGALAGYLSRRLAGLERFWRPLGIMTSTVLAMAVGLFMPVYYSGETEITIGYVSETYPNLSITLYGYVPRYVWWIFAALLFAVLIVGVLKVEAELGWKVLALALSGFTMVIGYFLYESYLYGVAAALVELPFNVGQVIVGISVSLPIYLRLRRVVASE